MALRFVYGDSYGGVQGAEQGYDQMRDARYFNSLAVQDRRRQMAAQEAAQRAALEDAAESRALSLFLNQAEMANRNRQFDVSGNQWERDFGLRSAQIDESRADREAQQTYQYDALRSGERQNEAQLGVQKAYYDSQKEYQKATQGNVADRNLAQALKGAIDVTNAGVTWASPAEVLSRFPDLTPAGAQVVFDLSQANARPMRDDFSVAQALARATKRRDQLPTKIQETRDAIPPITNWLGNLDYVAHSVLPGRSVRSRLGQQLRDFATEGTDLEKQIENLNLRLEFPQPVASAMPAPPPIPRTIIPVNGGPAAAPAPVPISGGIARPMTIAELNALPSGAPYINPSDGRVYYKK